MKILSMVILPLVCSIDFACLAIFLLLPKLGLEADVRSVVGDFVVSRGLAFALVSIVTVAVVLVNRFNSGAGQCKAGESVLLSLISGYVVFVTFYISQLILTGI